LFPGVCELLPASTQVRLLLVSSTRPENDEFVEDDRQLLLDAI